MNDSPLHKRNLSLDEKYLPSSFSPISKKKSWSSTNSFFSPKDNILSRRIQDDNDGHLSISIEDVGSVYSVEDNEEDIDDETAIDSKDNKKNILNDTKLYIRNITGYFYYLILTTVTTLIINGSTHEEPLFNVDSMFFVYLSPIFYKLAFRGIFFYSIKYDRNIIKFYYPIAFILGFCFRFLDYIPFLQRFVLNTREFDNNPGYIALFSVFLIYMFLVFFNELYKSKYRKLNFGLLIVGCLFIFLTVSFKFNNEFVLHVHHYFIGLLLHIVCQTKRSKISVINNAIGLGVFVEGISKWGFGELYYRLI